MTRVVEFGRLVGALVGDDPVREAEMIVTARHNYEVIKALWFPGWPDENEEVIVTSSCPICGRHTNIGWYAAVPVEYVIARENA